MTDEEIKKALEDVDNYEQAVNACLTFIHIYRWDDAKNRPDNEVLHCIGKLYTPGDVTPDITLQLSTIRGLVVELKRSFPQNSEIKDYWKDNFDELKKYDVQLVGWETPNKKVNQQELILIVDQKFTRKIIDYIEKNKIFFTDFSKNFCLVQYSPASGLAPGVFIRAEYGKIDDFKTKTTKSLSEGITVKLIHLLTTGLSQTKFLDYKPPIIYLMSTLWDHVFNTLPTAEDWRSYNTENSRKHILLTVTSSKLREFLSRNFADKNSSRGLKEEWIKEALENFVKLKLAERGKITGEYIIKYRKKIADEHDDANKHHVFAELLYKSGVQVPLGDFENDKNGKSASTTAHKHT